MHFRRLFGDVSSGCIGRLIYEATHRAGVILFFNVEKPSFFFKLLTRRSECSQENRTQIELELP
jgi:hypothetical protein